MRCDMVHPAAAITRQFNQSTISAKAHHPPIIAAGNHAILGIGTKRQNRTLMRFMLRPRLLRRGKQGAMQDTISGAENAGLAFMAESKPRDPGAERMRRAAPIQQIFCAAHASGGLQRAISALIFASSSPA